jgi:hypothetical protein
VQERLPFPRLLLPAREFVAEIICLLRGREAAQICLEKSLCATFAGGLEEGCCIGKLQKSNRRREKLCLSFPFFQIYFFPFRSRSIAMWSTLRAESSRAVMAVCLVGAVMERVSRAMRLSQLMHYFFTKSLGNYIKQSQDFKSWTQRFLRLNCVEIKEDCPLPAFRIEVAKNQEQSHDKAAVFIFVYVFVRLCEVCRYMYCKLLILVVLRCFRNK